MLDEFIELVIHVQLGKFMEAADPFAINGYLGHGAGTVGDQAEFAACTHVGIDTRFFIRDTPFGQKRFCAIAHRANAGAEYFYSGHGYMRIKPDIKGCFYYDYNM
jgi:hypothetical protein